MAIEPGAAVGREAAGRSTKSLKGLKFDYYFSRPDVPPFEQIEWERRTASILNEKGEVIFEQKDIEIPAFFSQLATNVVVSKYFKGELGSDQRERSLKQVIGRVANTIADWGIADGYFASERDGETFRHELTSLLVNQKVAFNSPVWFNVGVEDHPQCSACFINSVEDRMDSILELAKTEGMLFKYGSGAGVNLSPLRASTEGMSHGGQASGPVSFMRGYDAFAGVIKSGGKTRRAAKMVILDIDHPDVVEFIECKTREEQKAKALIAQGYDRSFNGKAYASVFFQNANHSVRVMDEFMRAVRDGKQFATRHVLPPRDVAEVHEARELLRKVAENAWQTGDPGIQFDSTINDWHTCANSDRIYASNPCSEYMFLDNSACNLASLNVMKFRREDGMFDVDAFRHAVRVTITAMEIIVGNASYPTNAIARNSYDYRPLGLGYSNLGALLMSLAMPYDSDHGRAYAAAVTALMHGEAYRTSAEIAGVTGPFAGFESNRDPMMRVIRKHADAVATIDAGRVQPELMEGVETVYREMLELGGRNGFRNAQVTVLAPTGTISFLMDCDTTGIEPDILLEKTKKLVGGGSLEIVNRTVPMALRRLGYDDDQVERIVDYIDEHEHIAGAPDLDPEHLPVFDCSLNAGGRAIDYTAHVKMMAAVQPFLSGAISKTVNMPHEATVEEIENVYLDAWKMGLKAITIYRNGCKGDEPIAANSGNEPAAEEVKAARITQRRKLPDERRSITHKFTIGNYKGYLTVGLYEDGSPGEIFIVMAKEGSFISGLMDSFATSISIALQYGVPLKVLVRKFIHTRFEPSGFTGNEEIPIASSVIDYVFRWLARKFLPDEDVGNPPVELNPGSDPVDHSGGGDSDPDRSAPSGGAPGAAGDSGSNGHGPSASAEQFIAAGASGNGRANGNSHVDANDPAGLRFGMDSPQRNGGRNGELTWDDSPPCPNCGGITIRIGTCHTCVQCAETTGCG